MQFFFDQLDKQKKFVVLGAVLLCGFGAYRLYAHLAREPAAAKIVPLVRTYTVGEKAGARASVYPGEVRGRYESQLAFQVTGKINARLVNVGDRVNAGQTLMTLDPKDIEQNLAAASAQTASARANYQLAADNAKRYNALFAQGAVSEAVRDQYATQLAAASAALRQAEAQANVSANQLGYTQLVSDVDGVVASISGEAGQIAAAGTPMAVVVRSGEREVQINVPENTPVRIGQQAMISFWALPGVQSEGFVREISPMADGVTRTFKVCVAVPELPSEAKLGMTAKVTLAGADAGAKADAFALPAQALYQVNGKTQVWLVREQHAHLADVKVGGYEGNLVLVESGLASGDVVITAGLGKLTPGQEVKAEEGGEQ